jgi:hypothetical protein
MKSENLLLIAGTGTKSGKTSIACKIIEQLNHPELVAIKITPHFHETTPGLSIVSEGPGYSIYLENNPDTSKDTSRMLKAGAKQVYFAKVSDKTLFKAFSEIIAKIPANLPIICESPALRHYVDPGLFIIMSSDSVNKQKDIKNLQELPHVVYTMEELENSSSLPISFANGKWAFSENR